MAEVHLVEQPDELDRRPVVGRTEDRDQIGRNVNQFRDGRGRVATHEQRCVKLRLSVPQESGDFHGRQNNPRPVRIVVHVHPIATAVPGELNEAVPVLVQCADQVLDRRCVKMAKLGGIQRQQLDDQIDRTGLLVKPESRSIGWIAVYDEDPGHLARPM